MPAVVACPKCNKKYKLPDKMLGKGVKCSQCETQFKASATKQTAANPDPRKKTAANQKNLAAQAHRAQDLKALGVEGSIERPAEVFTSAAMGGTNDPLGNHIIEDPGFGDGAEAILKPAEVEKPDDPNAAMFSNPALAKDKKKKRVGKQSKSRGSRKKTGATVCFVFSALTAIGAVYTIVAGPNKPEGIAGMVGYAVGAFLIPIALLIGGLVLHRKSKKS